MLMATYPCIWRYRCPDSWAVPCWRQCWHSSTTPVLQIGHCLKRLGHSRCSTVAVTNRMLHIQHVNIAQNSYKTIHICNCNITILENRWQFAPVSVMVSTNVKHQQKPVQPTKWVPVDQPIRSFCLWHQVLTQSHLQTYKTMQVMQQTYSK